MQRLSRQAWLVILSAIAGLGSDLSRAEDIAFELDPLLSSISTYSTLKPLGLDSVPQGEGGDMSNYFGAVTVRVDSLLNPGSIQFLSAEVGAEPSGEWLPDLGGGVPGDPGDPQPAEFGFLWDVPDGFLLGAVRDSVITLTSDPIPVAADGTFSSTQAIETTAGEYILNISSDLLGGEFVAFTDLGEDPANADNAAGPGSIVVGEDGVTTLTIPLDLTFVDTDIDFFYDGVLVGTFGEPTTMRIPGDANEDGKVDAMDLNAVGLNWQTAGNTWADGDFTSDGFVDAADLNVLGVNWQRGVPVAAAVPEPSCLFSALIVLSGGLWCRRWR